MPAIEKVRAVQSTAMNLKQGESGAGKGARDGAAFEELLKNAMKK